jgi:hypothetical protein
MRVPLKNGVFFLLCLAAAALSVSRSNAISLYCHLWECGELYPAPTVGFVINGNAPCTVVACNDCQIANISDVCICSPSGTGCPGPVKAEICYGNCSDMSECVVCGPSCRGGDCPP